MKAKQKAFQAIVTFLGLLPFLTSILRLIAAINQPDLVRLMTAGMVGSFILLLFLIALEIARRQADAGYSSTQQNLIDGSK